jgi:hypothetical protein
MPWERKAAKSEGSLGAKQGSSGGVFQFTVPTVMPTWNQILAMNQWERKRLRDSLHKLTFLSITIALGSQTRMGLAQKQSSMQLSVQEYLAMIRRKKSVKSDTANSKFNQRAKSARKSRSRKST